MRGTADSDENPYSRVHLSKRYNIVKDLPHLCFSSELRLREDAHTDDIATPSPVHHPFRLSRELRPSHTNPTFPGMQVNTLPPISLGQSFTQNTLHPLACATTPNPSKKLAGRTPFVRSIIWEGRTKSPGLISSLKDPTAEKAMIVLTPRDRKAEMFAREGTEEGDML